MKTYILNPDTDKPVSIEEWRKDENPTRANFVLVTLTDGKTRILYKNCSEEEMNFHKAEEYAEKFQLDGHTGFRLPTRHESIDLYDAKFIAGLNEALELIGGNAMQDWMWTGERDVDPCYSANLGWCSGGYNGCMYAISMYYSYLAVPVALYELGTSES